MSTKKSTTQLLFREQIKKNNIIVSESLESVLPDDLTDTISENHILLGEKIISIKIHKIDRVDGRLLIESIVSDFAVADFISFKSAVIVLNTLSSECDLVSHIIPDDNTNVSKLTVLLEDT